MDKNVSRHSQCSLRGKRASTESHWNREKLIKKNNLARCWWLMPVILATQEAEIRRIKV
jgi:hypothetical protein